MYKYTYMYMYVHVSNMYMYEQHIMHLSLPIDGTMNAMYVPTKHRGGLIWFRTVLYHVKPCLCFVGVLLDSYPCGMSPTIFISQISLKSHSHDASVPRIT